MVFVKPIYILQAFNMGTCIRQGDLFHSSMHVHIHTHTHTHALTDTHMCTCTHTHTHTYRGTVVCHSQHMKKSEDVLEKMPVNGSEG